MVFKGNLYHTTLYDRVAKLLACEEWADCCFSVAGNTFKAHKLILATSSPVFEAMFYGPLSTNDNIIITDLEPETFQLLLNYIYTDKVDVTNVEEAYALLYASKKYLLAPLIDTCIKFIKDNISVDNVITVLNYPEYMHEKQLISDAVEVFCQHPVYLFEQHIQSITNVCMKLVLQSNNMNIKEKNLIKKIFEWTHYYCEETGVPNTFDSRRETLLKNDLFQLLRFLTLSEEDLNEIVSDKNNLLLPTEIENIKLNINTKCVEYGKIIDTLCPIVTPRSLVKISWYTCHRSPYKSAPPVIIDTDNYIINTRLRVSKSLFITRISIPSRLAPVMLLNMHTKTYSEQITLTVSNESESKTVKLINFKNIVEYDASVNIVLPEPCLIKKDLWYKISFIWPRNHCSTYSYVVKCRDSHFFGPKVGFEFDDLVSQSSTDGSFISKIDYIL